MKKIFIISSLLLFSALFFTNEPSPNKIEGEKTFNTKSFVETFAENETLNKKTKIEPTRATIEPTVNTRKIQTSLPSTAPNGTYTNVDGNKVPRPYHAPSAPAGATAECRDGTYSFSENRRGTCSHHGGVAEWL